MDGWKKAEKGQKYRKNKGLTVTSISDIMYQGLANKRKPSPQLQHVTVDFMRFFYSLLCPLGVNSYLKCNSKQSYVCFFS